jgi:hypothetical protein
MERVCFGGFGGLFVEFEEDVCDYLFFFGLL